MFEVRHYLAANNSDPFAEWLRKLRDTKAKLAIIRRVNRLELGNFGDHRFLRDGVCELRIDVGPGYRVYYAQAGKTIILLLCGGDKSTQSKDILLACDNWRDWQQSKAKEEKSS